MKNSEVYTAVAVSLSVPTSFYNLSISKTSLIYPVGGYAWSLHKSQPTFD